ncbi:MAG: hypothetical protein QOH88_3079 [Verrucomicrobiota bacterium]
MALLATFTLAAPLRGDDAMLPNPKLTPGKAARNDKDRKGVPVELEKKVFDRYRIPWARRREFKIDHLIPLDLGGADRIENLWPQSLRVKPYNAERKELLARHLRTCVASGQMTLEQAQDEIRADWISCFVERLGMIYLR